jgi:hypothetical protein
MKLKNTLILIFIFPFIPLGAVTLTYNVRVRRIFNIEPVINQKKSRILASAAPIYYARRSHIVDQALNTDTCEDRNVFGSLLDVRYVPSKNFWAEVTTGLIRDQVEYEGTPSFEASRVGIDDIVLASGYRAFLDKKIQLVGYGLVGIPTSRDLSLNDRFGPLVGTRLYSIGGGGEISYAFLESIQRSFAAVAQLRVVHGFNRSWEPILPEDGQIQPGNVTDLLLTLQYREGRIIAEAGYNPTLFSNQALLLPAGNIPSDAFVRHSWYGTISGVNLKSFFDNPSIYGAGISTSTSSKFDTKIANGWIYFTLVF